MARALKAELFLDARASTAERPIWDPLSRRLLWVDVPAGEVHTTTPDGADNVMLKLSQPVGCAGLRRRGGLVLGTRDGFALFDPQATAPKRVFPVARANESVRMNDGMCDPEGRFLAGTLDERGAGGGLYRLTRRGADYEVSDLIKGARESNGLDWNPAGNRLYWIDTPTRQVQAFDYDRAWGRIGERRLFAEIGKEEGVPDGLVVDAEGGVWVALYGGGVVRRYTPEGRPDLEVRLPIRRPTCPGFGGSALDLLFVTTQRFTPDDPNFADGEHAGGIFTCRPGYVGQAPRFFDG